jgi:hypothetical protein
MKRLTFIAFVVLGVVMVSCSKENIRPNASTDQEVPQWRGASSVESTDDSTSEGEGGITDPNNDEDNNRRKRN